MVRTMTISSPVFKSFTLTTLLGFLELILPAGITYPAANSACTIEAHAEY